MRYSIIIPVFNRPAELSAALKSCLDQTFTDWEAIVVDDFSPVSLETVCLEFSDSRIRYIRNNSNLGAARSRNVGLRAAQGDYISFLDSDDTYFPDRMAELEIRLSHAPHPLVFHLQQRIFAVRNGLEVHDRLPARVPMSGERLDEFMLLNGNYIQTNSYVVERTLAQKYTFDVECEAWEDSKYILQCWLDCNSYVVIDKILSRYNDIRKTGRLSRQRDPKRHTCFLSFVRNSCSRKSYYGLKALADAELSFFAAPLNVLKSIFRGWRAGVSLKRCVIYICRSLLGFSRTEAILYCIRYFSLRGVKL